MSTLNRYCRRLNRELSFIGLGTVELGREWGIDASLPNLEKTSSIIDEAIIEGIDVIDTASSYGLSEKRIGLCLSQHASKPLLITKPGEHNILKTDERCQDSTTSSPFCRRPAGSYDFSQKAIINDIYTSLENLRIDKIDIALLHLDDQSAMEILNNGEAFDTLRTLRDKQIISFIGVSVNGEAAALKAVELKDLDVIETEFNLLYQTNLPAIKKAAAKNIAVFVRGSLGTGLLTYKVAPKLDDKSLPYREPILALLSLVNYDYELLTELALNFLYLNEDINCALIGADEKHYFKFNKNKIITFNNHALLKQAIETLRKFPIQKEFTQVMGEYYLA